MSLVTRRLPVHEWHKLKGHDLGEMTHTFNPETTTIIVVEDDDGKFVASCAVVPVLHLEGAYVDERYRGLGLALAQLVTELKHELEAATVPIAFAGVTEPSVGKLLADHFGAKPIPGVIWAVPVGKMLERQHG